MERSNSYLLKLSGEILGDKTSVFSPEKIQYVTQELKEALHNFSGRFAIVIGGGNIARGRELGMLGIPRVKTDHMGMLATCINGILLTERLIASGIRAKVVSALPCGNFTYTYSRDSALEWLKNGEVLVFVMGTGNPFFSTDTVSVLRAIELGMDTVLKATKVEGVYDRDPSIYSDAKMYHELTYEEAIEKDLKVMDREAFLLSKEHGLCIRVFNALKKGNLKKALSGERIGTLIKNAL